MSKFFELLNNIINKLNRSVSIDSQTLTDEEKAQVRANIGAGTGDGTGGGVLSWNDLEDRPFYDNRMQSHYSQVETPNPVSFHNQMMQYSFYKISDLVLTRDQIFSDMVIIDRNGDNIAPTENNIVVETSEIIATNDGRYGFCFVNTKGILPFTYSGYPMTIDVKETGIYYIVPLNSGVNEGAIYEIYIGEDLKQIDMKFIPPISSLPDVSDSDSNKILRVKNGVWSVDEVAELPKVTTYNDGMFLCVENGKWITKSMSEWSGGLY